MQAGYPQYVDTLAKTVHINAPVMQHTERKMYWCEHLYLEINTKTNIICNLSQNDLDTNLGIFDIVIKGGSRVEHTFTTANGFIESAFL